MLFLTRKPGQSITISPRRELPDQWALKRCFADGPIYITVKRVLREEVKLGIHAHSDLVILREEIAYQPLADSHHFERCRIRQGSGSSIRMILARNVQYHRTRCRLTLAQLSDLSGLSQGTLSAIEQGKGEIRVDVLDNLAMAFGISVAQLLKEM